MKKFNDCRGDSSVTWTLVKQILPNRKCGSNTYESENIENILDKTEEFNCFFANIGKITYDMSQQTLENNHIPSLEFSTLLTLLTINSLKETHTVYSDSISLQFVRVALYITAYI